MMPLSSKTILHNTMYNLKFIEERKDISGGPFEVTQLINSFLMVVLQNLDELKSTWDCENPSINITNIRHALAHGNIYFEPDENQEIKAIHLWTSRNRKIVDWDYRLEVEQLRVVLKKFVEFAEKHNPPLKEQPLQKGNPYRG